MSDFERHAAGEEAHHGAPGRHRTPEAERRQDMLRRYLGAVATASSTAGETAREGRAAPVRARRRTPAHATAPRVGQVMRAPAVPVPGYTPFLDVARTLAHEHLSAIPVVDAAEHVVGVVTRADLPRSPVRGAPEIREAIESRILREEHHLGPHAIEVTVEGGVVTVEGRGRT
ncbi:CBS domain-containing protein [Streptomyces antimycoticus]|uniref:CBS domain-containing protein n=1 Tax=Streptomyces antimycoticus TaxID=68175 RepID=UPI00342E629E